MLLQWVEARTAAYAGVSLALALAASWAPLPDPAKWSTDQPFLGSTLPGPRMGFSWKQWMTCPLSLLAQTDFHSDLQTVP